MTQTFTQASEAAAPYTLIGPEGLRVLWDEAQRAPAGDFVEVGVYKGGSAMVLHAAAPRRKLHLFDTFTGHPPVQTEHDKAEVHHVGRYDDTAWQDVAQRLGAGDVEFWVGEFPKTLHKYRRSWAIALIHIDVDLYASTEAVLSNLAYFVMEGGVIICDDYCHEECPGVKRAVDEFMTNSPSAFTFSVAPTGQAIVRRR